MNATTQQATTTAQAHEVIDLESMADEAQRAWQVAAAAGRDSRALSADHRAAALNALCRALRLNPLTNPIIYVTLNGKEVLYVTRQATDQIAARLGLIRETIEGPEVRDFAGTKLLYCKVRVSTPGGVRSETSTATLPPLDLVNAIMKVETKAKRRGTLSIAGLGMLGEDDVESMGLDAALDRTPPSSEPTTAQNSFALDLDDCTFNRDAVDVWMKHRAALTADGEGVREAAWGALVKHVMHLMEVKKTGAEKFIRSEIAARDEAIRAQRDATPPTVEASTETSESAAEPGASRLDPPTIADFRAQLERCLSLNAVADLWRASRGELVEADRGPAWAASLDRVAVLTSAPSTQGIGALLKKRIAELDGPKPTPPDGGPSGTRAPQTTAAPDATGGAVPTGAASDATQASAGPRLVVDGDERERRLVTSAPAWAAYLAEHVAGRSPVFHLCGSYWKPREAFAAEGVAADRYEATLSAIEAREGKGPDAAREALDGYRTRRVMPKGAGAVVRMEPRRQTAPRTGTDG